MDLIKFPDARLHRMCEPVTVFDDAFYDTATQMLTACQEWKGYALAAPQVGIQKRFFVLVPSPATKAPLIICNPAVFNEQGSYIYPESCLSMPGVVGRLARPASFLLTYTDGGNDPAINNTDRVCAIECEGLLARIVQHEIDHLDGRLFVDRLDPITKNKIYPAINKLRRR